MTDLSPGEQSFLTAREATKRGCVERWRKDHPEAPDAFGTLPLLLAPELRMLAWEALGKARGPRIDNDPIFPATIWVECFDKINNIMLRGAQATRGGVAFRRPLSDFVKLLHERSQAVAPKRQGWVIEPTTNLDGHRTNESTAAMHALFLDCDGRGSWDVMLRALSDLDFCFVAYQSGGYSPATPKWRVVLPLSSPFATTTENLREAWRSAYHYARIVFGSIGYLYGEGFDSATDTPCAPWFLTEKRDANDPPREVIFRNLGHSLDMLSLIMSLPAAEETEEDIRLEHKRASTGLTDERLDEIINALAAVTNSVPSGRHNLYLALPGVMLDRGVSPDDVLAIIEGVSASYPRKHADKHKDNIHNAKTTISRWQMNHQVTRIGTLNDQWPAIAMTLDRVLPDPTSASIANMTAMMLQQSAPMLATPDQTLQPTQKKRRRRLTDLGRQIQPIVKQMTHSKDAKRRASAVLLSRIVEGEPFIAQNAAQVDELVAHAMISLGFNLPNATWVQILDLAADTFHAMDFTQNAARVATAEQAFLKGQQDRRKWNKKKKGKNQKLFDEAQSFFNEAARLEAIRRNPLK